MRIIKGSTEPMRVKVYVINEGTSSQYYGLKNADENTVLTAAPNNWKSKRGAENWAKRHGFTVVESSRSIKGWFSDSEKITIFYNGFKAYSGDTNDVFGALYKILYKDSEATEACADYLDSIGYTVNANAREVSMAFSKLIQSYVSEYGNELDDIIYWDHGSIEFAPYTTSIRSSRSIQGAASGAGLYNHGVDLEGYGADKSRDTDYLKKLADGVVEEYNNYFTVDSLVYEISDVAITFIDGDVVIYIQPLDGIKPDMEDIESDIEELSESVISEAIPMF